MMRKLRNFALLTCITAATAFGGHLAFADTGSPSQQDEMRCGEHQGGKGHRGKHHLRKMARELGLTEQQKTEAKALLEKNFADNKGVIERMKSERRQLRSLVHSGSADESAIRAQAAKVAGVEAELAVKKAQVAREFLALLTPEQVTKYQSIMEKRQSKMKGGFGCCEDAPIK